jgi:hypothetical protein
MATNFVTANRRKSLTSTNEERAVPPPGRSQRETWARFCVILGHSSPPSFFVAISSPGPVAANSYPTGNGRAQIRRRIAPNTRRVRWPSANRSQ